MRDWLGEHGVGSYPDAFNMLHLATGCKYVDPVEAKDNGYLPNPAVLAVRRQGKTSVLAWA